MSWIKFRPFFRRWNKVKFALVHGLINKYSWPKSKVLRMARFDFIPGILKPNVRRYKVRVAVPTMAVNDPSKFVNDKKLLKQFSMHGFKHLDKAHDKVEQFTIGL